ncbi:MAG: maleylpyruvate isomerase N-terminal domain-containing protein [Micropruina sp.]|uniref:maleylpyruvate isomerase family mycothiol-dependent enzyme n=1 Tax=Micropruina sp. TaxID=2737536 RepID=UPI0039E61661
MDTAEDMLKAAEAFVALVSEVPHDAWDRPALGVWDVRSLVGHTARAVLTALDYLNKPAAMVELRSAAEYLAAGYLVDRSIHEAVAERGVAAGHDLGDEPAEVVETMIGRLRAAIAGLDGDPVITTLLGTMRYSDYLETRMVELVVHTSDIALAIGREPRLPARAVGRVLHIICDAAMLNGRGLAAIRQLSARDGSAFGLL